MFQHNTYSGQVGEPSIFCSGDVCYKNCLDQNSVPEIRGRGLLAENSYDPLCKTLRISFSWVPGHAGIIGNEEADLQ